MSDEGVIQIIALINDFRTEMRELKEDVAELKKDVAELKKDVAELKKDVAELKTRVTKLEEKQEKDKREIIEEFRVSQEVIGKMFAEQNMKIKKIQEVLNMA